MAIGTAPPETEQRSLGRRLRNPWLSFAVRRLVRFVVSLWVLITGTFLMIHLVPGDPVRAALGLTAPPELVAARREALGLNDPLLIQYVKYLTDVLTGNLGTSMTSGLPVAQQIGDRLGPTLILSVLAFILVIISSVPLGTFMAALTRGGRRRGSELAFTSSTVVIAAIPEFLFAVGLVALFSVLLRWFPVAGRDGIASYVLPVLALAVGPAAVISRIVRVEMLAVLDDDFIRTAHAKRLPAWKVYLRHALPNALTASLTLGGLLLTSLVAGTVLVENVFAWPGLGSLIVQSILERTTPRCRVSCSCTAPRCWS